MPNWIVGIHMLHHAPLNVLVLMPAILLGVTKVQVCANKPMGIVPVVVSVAHGRNSRRVKPMSDLLVLGQDGVVAALTIKSIHLAVHL